MSKKPDEMEKPWSRWIMFLYGPLFKIIGFFYRNYSSNRARVARLKSNKRVATVIQALTIAMLLGWFVIWYFTDDDRGIGLIDEVKQSIGLDRPEN